MFRNDLDQGAQAALGTFPVSVRFDGPNLNLLHFPTSLQLCISAPFGLRSCPLIVGSLEGPFGLTLALVWQRFQFLFGTLRNSTMMMRLRRFPSGYSLFNKSGIHIRCAEILCGSNGGCSGNSPTP